MFEKCKYAGLVTSGSKFYHCLLRHTLVHFLVLLSSAFGVHFLEDF